MVMIAVRGAKEPNEGSYDFFFVLAFFGFINPDSQGFRLCNMIQLKKMFIFNQDEIHAAIAFHRAETGGELRHG